jgi:hypothetical protein
MFENEIYITIDADWAGDDVLGHSVRILEETEAAATFFLTNATPALNQIRECPRFEVGIHPNFNALLADNREGRKGGVGSIVDELLDLVPQARSMRSHSLTQSSVLDELLPERGIDYDCSPFIPFGSGIERKPWRHRTGLVKVPFMWSDYMHCAYGWKWSVREFLRVPGLKVFAFHPIHIVLNTSSLDEYERDKRNETSPRAPYPKEADVKGTLWFLRALIDEARRRGLRTVTIGEITLEPEQETTG